MEYLTNWKFWLAVVIVVFVTHYAMAMILPKLSAGKTS